MNQLDIVERLRRWPNLPGANWDKALMDEAATQIEQLRLAEEGAAEAFGVVVRDKRNLEAEVKRLQALLDGAHATIRSMSARGGYQPVGTTGPVQPPPRKP